MRKLESIYKTMGWDTREYEKLTQPTAETTNDSRAFGVFSGENTLAALKRVFGIKDNVFDEKFQQACSGSGQEERRIATLHSSSLCALLFFYNVTEKHPLTFYVEGVGEVTFQEAVFEYQNCVIANANPSNMDVTLLGKCGDKKVILFLESKFSEYITGTQKKLNINCAYLQERISKNLYQNWQWSKDEESAGKEFSVSISEKPAYLGGLKQMISHYVGVRKFEKGIQELKNGQNTSKNLHDVTANQDKQEIQLKVRNYALDGDVIIALGSIIFDVYKKDKKHTELEEYETLYTKLMRQIKEDAADNGSELKILTTSYTYQELFESNQNWSTKDIRKFYFSE